MAVKMTWYAWEIPGKYPESMAGAYDRSASPDRFDLRKGIRLPDNWGVPRFQFKATMPKLRKYDCLANSTGVPLVSSRLGEMLVQFCGDSIQLFPATIEARGGQLEGYSLLNVTDLGSVVDTENSKYICIAGTTAPLTFSKLVFVDSPDPRPIFRDRFYHSFIIVAESLKAEIEALRATGVALYRDSEVYSSAKYD